MPALFLVTLLPPSMASSRPLNIPVHPPQKVDIDTRVLRIDPTYCFQFHIFLTLSSFSFHINCHLLTTFTFLFSAAFHSEEWFYALILFSSLPLAGPYSTEMPSQRRAFGAFRPIDIVPPASCERKKLGDSMLPACDTDRTTATCEIFNDHTQSR